MADPFSQVFDALWTLVESSSRVTNLVSAGNRIKFNSTTDRGPVKRNAQDADYPELELLFTDVTGNLRDSSSSTMCRRQYQFGIAVGDLRANDKLLPLEFALFAALTNWKTILTTLEWPEDSGWRFVKDCNIVSSTAGIEAVPKNRGITGWTSLWTVEVRMDFRTTDLQSYGAGTGS